MGEALVWRTVSLTVPFGLPHKPVQSTLPVPSWYPLPSSPAATPAKAPATGNMAAAVISAHATLLSSAVVDFMDIYKSWACPWAPL
jgi:hypothetical protein